MISTRVGKSRSSGPDSSWAFCQKPVWMQFGGGAVRHECVTSTDGVCRVLQAYQAFASRVSHLKRKLDALKSTLPDLDDSPIPSPSADAPSPTGSESPFHGMELDHAGLDGSAMDDEAEPPAPSPLSSPGGSPIRTATFDNDDNRMVEDMDLSDEEAGSSIIGELGGGASMMGGLIALTHSSVASPHLLYSTSEQRIECTPKPAASAAFPPARAEPSVGAERPPPAQFPAPASADAAAVDSIDLAKIGSILNSLSSVMKNSGE